MLFKETPRDEELWTLFAFKVLLFLSSRQFEQILIGRKSLLLKFKLSFQNMVFTGLLLNFLSDFNCFLIGMLVLQVQRLRQSFKVVLSVDEVFDRHLSQSEQLHEVSVTHALNVFSI